MKDISDRKNHLTQKQIWLLKMLFKELGNKNLNEALKQWEEREDAKLISRLEVGGEIETSAAIPAEPAIIQRGDDLIRRRSKRKSRSSE